MKFYADSVLDYSNPANFNYSGFANELGLYSNAIIYEKRDTLTDIYVKKGVIEIAKYITYLIKDQLHGPIGDYAVYRFLTERDHLQAVYDSLIKGGNVFGDKFFEERFKEMARSEENSPDNEKAELSKLGGILYYNGQTEESEEVPAAEIISYLAGRYNGKVIYIDVWFTTCGPCIFEIQGHSPALHEKYKGKDVVFVNLCVNSKSDQWVYMINTTPVHGENYFLDKDSGIIFTNEHKINSFPTYMIMDRKGRLVSGSALRPSQLDELSKQIDELLK